MSLREYCIYKGRNLPSADMSDEHVIPQALGGVDEFCIRASRSLNSNLGAKLDGALANEFFIAQRRNEFDVRGRSGSVPTARVRSARLGEDSLPVQVDVDKQQGALHIYSPKDGRQLEQEESAGQMLTLNLKLDIHLRLRFVAKVALGAGYFAYGPTFSSCARTDLLRALMHMDRERMSNDLLVVDYLMDPSSPSEAVIRDIGKLVGLSSVVIVPSSRDITFSVTCVQEFCGIVRVPARTSELANSGDFADGHVLACQPPALHRGSFRYGLELLAAAISSQRSAGT